MSKKRKGVVVCQSCGEARHTQGQCPLPRAA